VNKGDYNSQHLKDTNKIEDSVEINYSKILETLPVAVSIQNTNFIVVYENKEMKTRYNTFLKDYCYRRWHPNQNSKTNQCIDCPALITLRNNKPTTIIRKLKDENGNVSFVKVIHSPLILSKNNNEEKYIVEVVYDVTECFLDKIRREIDIKQFKKEIWLSITSFGNYGGDVITSEELPFVKKEEQRSFLLEMSLYLFTAIGQGENYNEGLYGLLPVLNHQEYVVLVYAFRFSDEELSEVRLQGRDYGLLMIFTKISHEKIVIYRKEILELLDRLLKHNCEKKDLTLKLLSIIKKELVNLIERLENQHFESNSFGKKGN